MAGAGGRRGKAPGAGLRKAGATRAAGPQGAGGLRGGDPDLTPHPARGSGVGRGAVRVGGGGG